MKVAVALLVLLLIGLQYRLWFGDGSIQEVRRLQLELTDKRQVLDELQQRNAALEAEVSDLKSGLDAIEERARTELGMIGEDETFYQFVRQRGQSEESVGGREGGAVRDDDALTREDEAGAGGTVSTAIGED